MKVIFQETMRVNSGKSWIVRKGQRIRINFESIMDFVVFDLHNLHDRFDQARTKANQGKIYISTGDRLYSKLNTVLMRKLPLDRSGRLAADAFGPAPVLAAATASQSQPAAADAAAGARDAGATRPGTPPEDTASIATPRSCSPGDPAACSFNHRDWAVLLKLKPQAQLDTLAPGPRSTEPPLPEPGDL